jgi:hypothetical protein
MILFCSVRIIRPKPSGSGRSWALILGDDAIVQQHLCAYLDSPDVAAGEVQKGKAGSRVFSQEIPGVEQQAFAYPLDMKQVVMAVTDKIKAAGTSQVPSQFRIMIAGDAVGVGGESGMGSVVVDIAKGGAASGHDEVLVADVVAVDKVNRALEGMKIGQHEGRDQISAVEQQFGTMVIGQLDGPMQVGNVVVTIGEHCNAHGYLGWPIRVMRP